MTPFPAASSREEIGAENSDLEVERSHFCPQTLVLDTFADLSSRARRKDVSLEFGAACALPETIFSDCARLRQILGNLISNAIRYTTCGCVKVVAGIVSIEGRALLSFDVIDSGTGIPTEAYEAIFDPSVGIDRPEAQRLGSAEFGLPISRRFARLLGGDLFVRSSGEGSSFTVRIDPGPLDGVKKIPPSEIRSHQCSAAIRLLERLERVETSLQIGDRDAIDELARWMRGAFDAARSEAFREPADALSLLSPDAKDHEITALIDELRSIAEQVAIERRAPTTAR